MNRHEVIVVGAGPAGSVAAALLARHGRDVLLLDRQQFPRDKVCGDGVSAPTVDRLRKLGLGEKVLASGFNRIRIARVKSPGGRVLDAEFEPTPGGSPELVAPRMEFDDVLRQQAVALGARFQVGEAKGPLLRDGRVVGVSAVVNGEPTEIQASVVIGADGAMSAIARGLGRKQRPAKYRAIALRAYVQGINCVSDRYEFILSRNLLPGYAWVFPLGRERANVGVGVHLDVLRRHRMNIRQLFGRFVESELKPRLTPDAVISDVRAWPIEFGSLKRERRAFNGALLVGDAGAFVGPLTARGIPGAVHSAQLAAEVVQEALTSGDVSGNELRRFDEECHRVLWPEMRKSQWIQSVVGRIPFALDLLVSVPGLRQFTRHFLWKL